MIGRSLKASQQGIQLAKQALIRKRWKQKDLIGFVCQSRQPIYKFFTGKPVDREIFVGICERLGFRLKNLAEKVKAFWAQGFAPLQNYLNEEFISFGITDIATAIAVRTHHLVETFHRNVSTTVRNVLIDVSTAINR